MAVGPVYSSQRGITMQKINLEELQQAANSRRLSGQEQQPKRTEQQERVIEETWITLLEIYCSSMATQYGDVMPESWILLLKGITPRQISDGLGRLAARESAYPPNAAEFRQLCLPETISPNGHNSAAYLSFDDPKHPRNDPNSPEYVKPVLGIESESYKTKRHRAGNTALKDMMKDL